MPCPMPQEILSLRSRFGFTIIEMLVTVTMISILALAAVPVIEVSSKRAKEVELRRALSQIRAALDAYYQAGTDGRLLVESGASGYPQSLSVLVDGVPDLSSPGRKRIFFLRRLPRDPFSPNGESAESSWGLRSYDSPADDPQAGVDVFDIYSRSADTGLNGVPYKDW